MASGHPKARSFTVRPSSLGLTQRVSLRKAGLQHVILHDVDDEDCKEGDEEYEDLKLKILYVGCMEFNARSPMLKVGKVEEDECKYIFDLHGTNPNSGQ